MYLKQTILIITLSLLLGLPSTTLAARPSEAEPDQMLQFTAGGHILDFTPTGVYAATGSHAYRVEFVAPATNVAAATTPIADTPSAGGSSGAPLEPGDLPQPVAGH